MKTSPPTVMTIAGSDSGGGAGLQADLKTFAALGCYGTSVVTAVTAQNTQTIDAIHPIPVGIVNQQIDTVVSDITVNAVKTGMLAQPELVLAVATKLKQHKLARIVVDPVMVSTSGVRLAEQHTRDVLIAELLPLATVVTPNIAEAQILSGMRIGDTDTMCEVAQVLAERIGTSVVVKGGHLETGDECADVLFTAGTAQIFKAPRWRTSSTHGTGCTFASALAAMLAHGKSLADAVQGAQSYVNRAIGAAFAVGSGNGPVNHFYAWWSEHDA